MANGTWTQPVLEEPTQVCNRCGEPKVLSHFPYRKDRGTHHRTCRSCWGRRLPPLPRTCEHCGELFTPATHGDTRFCSLRCSRRHRMGCTGTWEPNPVVDGAKRCGRCREVLPVAEFRPRSGGRAGYHGYCHACVRAWQRDAKRRKRGLPLDLPTADLRSLARRRPEGFTFVDKDAGYVYLKSTGHHRADRYGWVLQHIVVAERKFGFPITREFTVHHRNGDRADNRPENLELRYGNHGKGADVIPALLRLPEMRMIARAVLEQYDD